MVRLHERALSVDAARRDVASAILGRPVAPLDETRAQLAADEQVAPLLVRSGAGFTTPGVAAIVTDAARVVAIRTAILDDELRRVYEQLAARGLSPLAIKGAHLAHAVYPDPLCRSRCDTDLLIEPSERERTDVALRDAGYARSVHVRGTLILGQWHFERRDRTGIMHYLDVHWRAAAPLVVDTALPARAIIAAAQPLPALGGNARCPALDDALALACMHLVAHHLPAIELRWAYDLHLLVSALGDAGVDRFVAAAQRRGYCAVCAHALGAAAAVLDDDPLRSLASRLAGAGQEEPTAALLHVAGPGAALWLDASPPPGAGQEEPTAALLHVAGPGAALWLDLRTAGWRDRLRLVREHLVPDPAYMRAAAGGRPLAVAYTVRAFNGVRRWFSASDRTAE